MDISHETADEEEDVWKWPLLTCHVHLIRANTRALTVMGNSFYFPFICINFVHLHFVCSCEMRANEMRGNVDKLTLDAACLSISALTQWDECRLFECVWEFQSCLQLTESSLNRSQKQTQFLQLYKFTYCRKDAVCLANAHLKIVRK